MTTDDDEGGYDQLREDGWTHADITTRTFLDDDGRYRGAKAEVAGTVSYCSVDGCGQDAKVRGWCIRHYHRWRRHGDPLAMGKMGRPRIWPETCSVEGCNRPSRARGWCRNHYQQWRERAGLPDPTDPRHGTINGYNNLGCRCRRCTDANSVSHAAYMNQHPEQRAKANARGRQRWASGRQPPAPSATVATDLPSPTQPRKRAPQP